MSIGDPMGTRIAGRFRLESLVGRGGMGSIYRALDDETGATVALKMMASEGTDPRRFEREARLLSDLSDEHIVRYIAHGQTEEGNPFLAMEWLEGCDLGRRLDRGTLELHEVVAIGRQAADAIAVVHANGIIHRDVKPGNLFLVGGDPAQLKLVDFGIARHNERLTMTSQAGVLLGSVGYMAPEQARGLHDFDARADLFALGCVLFECVTGVPPFSGPNAVALIAKVLLAPKHLRRARPPRRRRAARNQILEPLPR